MFIDLPINDGCSFCDYLAGRRPYVILRRRELSAILVTREQRGRAHVLVIPTQHRPTILDLESEEACAVMLDLVEVARAIEKSERAAGVAVWQNNGIPADQTIAHVHFHVAATRPGGGTERGKVDELPLDQVEAIAARLRVHLEDR
jgi:histidine triad (HIT) family protein